MRILQVSAMLLALAGCASSPEKPVATVPVTQTVTDVRYVPIRPDLTAQIVAPAPAATFGGLWQEVQGWRAVAAGVNARLACIGAIQSLSATTAPACALPKVENPP